MSIQKSLALLLIFAVLFGCILTGCTNANSTDPSVLAEKAINTIAVTVGDHQINAVELNYYYVEIINSFCNEYSYYLYYIMDVYTPLNEQVFDEEIGQSWADYFLDIAVSNLKGTYLLYDAAVAAGMTLSASDEAIVQSVADSIRYYAEYYEFDSVEDYMVDLFGYGADLESYCQYYRTNLLADNYYTAYFNSLDFSQEELAAYEAKTPLVYNAYSYAYYTVYVSEYLTGGTEDASGNMQYTDAQNVQALAASKADAEALAGGQYADAVAFNEAIASMKVNEGLASVSCTQKVDQLYAEIDSSFLEWVTDASRKGGETTVIEKTTTSDDVTVTDGYYVVLFLGMQDNAFAMKNVRQILVAFEEETIESREKAYSEAQGLLQTWLEGGATENSFAALADQESDEGSSTTGGLCENVFPGQMAEAFEAWCYEADRKSGDYGIVESEYGYHVLYFVGNADMTYRDYMVTLNLRSATISAWYAEQLDALQFTIKTTQYVPLDMILAG